MFPARINLFTLLGFRISVDLSWFLLALYLVITLSTRYFPSVLPHLTTLSYVSLAIFGALGMFCSIIFHELAHAIVARSFHLPIGGITLFIFGGVAELRQEPKTPRSEFWVAIAGPIASVLIASLFSIIAKVLKYNGYEIGVALFSFLAVVNTVLALFNLAPAFPLDGGRILRSLIWWRTGNLKRATRIASAFGFAFGIFLSVLGFIQILGGSTLGGTWQLLIGVFLTMAASQSRRQTESAEDWRGVTIIDIMNKSPLTVSAHLTVDVLVRDYVYAHNQTFLIVVENDHALGFIGTDEIRRIPQKEWNEHYTRTTLTPFTHNTTAFPDTPALDVLRKLQTNGVGYAAILEGSKLVGSVSEAEFTNYLSVREALSDGLNKTEPNQVI